MSCLTLNLLLSTPINNINPLTFTLHTAPTTISIPPANCKLWTVGFVGQLLVVVYVSESLVYYQNPEHFLCNPGFQCDTVWEWKKRQYPCVWDQPQNPTQPARILINASSCQTCGMSILCSRGIGTVLEWLKLSWMKDKVQLQVDVIRSQSKQKFHRQCCKKTNHLLW